MTIEMLRFSAPSPVLHHKTIASAAADALRRRILDGEFEAGTQLRQDALAHALGMSRIPIREALLQLESEGLVTILPHRGAVVSKLSPSEIEEMFELRSILEPRLLRRSAPRLTRHDYEDLDAILREYRAELRAHHVARWGELNTAFHMLLYRHADRPRTLAIVGRLLQNCDRYTRVQLTYTRGFKRAEAEHAKLMKLCRTGKVGAACKLLGAHIENVRQNLIEFLARPAGERGGGRRNAPRAGKAKRHK